tara:strand:- start:3235 stop:3627 length:393 start_codon:yes stop_codon:yes gene_type:complete
MINTVRLQENGYLVNGSLTVPMAEGNRHYQEVQDWIALGNTPEAEVEVTQYKTQFTSIEYLDKFTEAEQVAIVTATTASIDIKRFYDKVLAANFIDVEDVMTVGGLDALIASGVLVAERKAVILAPELVV